MEKKRIIPCLDLKDGQVVKGVKFTDIKEAGNPMELAIAYEKAGADELVILDIQGKTENRKNLLELIGKLKEKLKIPLIIGGGIRSLQDIQEILNAGSDKVSIGSGAVKDPQLIKKAALEFGSKKIVVAIDGKKRNTSWDVYVKGGQKKTELDVIEWAKKVAELGAGEILLTSIDRDGTKTGYDLKLTRKVREVSGIPIIASGGAGRPEHFLEGVTEGKADGVLAASIFHFGIVSIKEIKTLFREQGIEVS